VISVYMTPSLHSYGQLADYNVQYFSLNQVSPAECRPTSKRPQCFNITSRPIEETWMFTLY